MAKTKTTDNDPVDRSVPEHMKEPAEVAMPEPQTATVTLVHTQPGEKPKVVLPASLGGVEKPKEPKKLTLEQRVNRLETAVARGSGVDLETYPID
jgi:hypothetical protein